MKNKINVNMDHLCDLAGVFFSEEEKKRCEKELLEFIGYSEIINQAYEGDDDIESCKKTATPFREDVDRPFGRVDDLLKNGPYVDNRSYIVPPQKKEKGKEREVKTEIKNTGDSRGDYEAVIGLEIHAQLKTRSKLFCGCSAGFGAEPNRNTCPVCSGQPGALPVINREAVKMAIMAGHNLNCVINEESIFARKNYFYPDLPKGYQISQFDRPLCGAGSLSIEVNGNMKKIRINRIHMEEDAGKLVHAGAPGIWGAKASAVDFNRSSVPLIEIVSEPDLRSPQEAREYVIMLRAILVNLGICDGNLEEGSLRCDANISLRLKGDEKLGVKTEIKNINSFKAIERAIAFEIERQYKLIVSGIPVEQQTRLWDESSQKTFIMRTKEESHDYKYFPDPDLLPLEVSAAEIESLKDHCQIHPLEKKALYLEKYSLSSDQARFLMVHPEYSDFFEELTEDFNDKKLPANWFFNKLMSFTKNLHEIPFTAKELAYLVKKIDSGELNDRLGLEILKKSFSEKQSPVSLIDNKKFTQITDMDKITRLAEEIVAEFPEQVENYRKGKVKLLSFFIGELMKRTRGQANPKLASDIFLEKLNQS